MIVKGIVESVIDRNNIKVRIPFLNGAAGQVDATPTEDLPNATICALPNISFELSTGDIVWVEFENVKWDQPVIVGFLDIEAKTKITLNLDSVSIATNAVLPQNTRIGQVTSEEISCLHGVTDNLGDYIANNMQVYNLDLSQYDNGDIIPVSVLQSIPENAFIIATTMTASGGTRYWQLLEKTKITNTNDNNPILNAEYPQYNYIFFSATSLLKIESQTIIVN